jgi:hypothetical protein
MERLRINWNSKTLEKALFSLVGTTKSLNVVLLEKNRMR